MLQRFSAFIILFVGLQMSYAQLETAQETLRIKAKDLAIDSIKNVVLEKNEKL